MQNPYQTGYQQDGLHVDYIGDVNLKYGGYFVVWSRRSLHYDFAHVIEVIDLDSACGFRSAIMVEHSVITIPSKQKRLSCYDTCGFRSAPIPHELLAIHNYGYSDNQTHRVFQPDDQQSTEYDGWQAERETPHHISDHISNMIEMTLDSRAY